MTSLGRIVSRISGGQPFVCGLAWSWSGPRIGPVAQQLPINLPANGWVSMETCQLGPGFLISDRPL